MKLCITTGCCTAILAYGFTDWTALTKAAQISFLEIELPKMLKEFSRVHQSGLDDALDYKMIYTIITDSQENRGRQDALIRLGFAAGGGTENGQRNRHQETGGLVMYTNTLENLRNARLMLLKELKEGNIPSKEEGLRRLQVPEFSLDRMRKQPVYQKYFKNEPLRRATLFPSQLQTRKEFVDSVKDLTSGYDILKDPVLAGHLRTLTWGEVKDRCLQYRQGIINV